MTHQKSLPQKRESKIVSLNSVPDFRKVNLRKLKGEAQYRLSFFRNIEPLLKSLQIIGQTSPLLCRETKTGCELFSGFMRKEAMLKLGYKSAWTLLWKEKELSELSAFRFAFFENALTRGLNLAEQAKAVVRLRELGFSDSQIASDYFQKAGIGLSVSGIDLLSLFRKLAQDWQRYFTEKELSLKHLGWFLNLPTPEQNALSFLLKLKPTASQLREFLELAEEIIKRDQSSLVHLLQVLSAQSILKEKKLTPAQQLEKLMIALRKLRYPEWTKLLNRHQKLLWELKIPPEVKISPIDYFEEPKYRLELILREDQELAQIFENLVQASKNPTWKKLFELNEN